MINKKERVIFIQTKKEEMRNAIINAAEVEFFAKGFKNTSLRTIVKNARTTIGNFYNYFDNKEAVYSEIVDAEYKGFLHFLEHHENEEKLGQLVGLEELLSNQEVLFDIVKGVIPSLSTRFVILLECSEGTKYQESKNLLTEMIYEHYMEHVDNDQSMADFGKILSKQFIDAVTSIIRNYHDNEDKMKELIVELILFYMLAITHRSKS